MIVAYIAYTFQKDKDFYVEVDEIQAIEDAYFEKLSTANDGGEQAYSARESGKPLSMPA